MKRLSMLLVLALLLGTGLGLAACTQPTEVPTELPTEEVLVVPTEVPTEVPVEMPTEDILTIAAADGRFAKLVELIGTAGLTETLAGPGPFTLFAPTDEAFAALPEGTLDELTPEELAEILLGHVVSAQVLAADIAAAPEMTVEGITMTTEMTPLKVVSDGLVVTVGEDAMVIQPDILATNGVIHVIDKVLLPAEEEAEE